MLFFISHIHNELSKKILKLSGISRKQFIAYYDVLIIYLKENDNATKVSHAIKHLMWYVD